MVIKMSGPNQMPVYSNNQSLYSPVTNSGNQPPGGPPSHPIGGSPYGAPSSQRTSQTFSPSGGPVVPGAPNLNNYPPSPFGDQTLKPPPPPSVGYSNSSPLQASPKTPYADKQQNYVQNGPIYDPSSRNSNTEQLNSSGSFQVNGHSLAHNSPLCPPPPVGGSLSQNQMLTPSRLPVQPPMENQKLSNSSLGGMSPINQFGGPSPHSNFTDGKLVPKTSQVPLSGLPLPYNNQNFKSPSPQVTPGTSQPPSARSSRNPSPISTQRYDYMEGQFSNKPSPSNSSVGSQNLGPNSNAALFPKMKPVGENGPPMTSPMQNAYPPSGMPFTPTSSPANSAPPMQNLHPFTQGTSPAANSTPQMQNLHPFTQSTSPAASSSPQMQNMYPYTPTNTQANSEPGPGMPPMPNTPGSGVIRSRYPQQLGYNQMPSQPSPSPYSPYQQQQHPNQQQQQLPEGPVGGVSGYDPQLHAKMAGMSVHSSFSKLWGNDNINLLQDRNILPPVPVEPPKPVLTPERPNCSPDIFRCTLTKVPDTSSLLQKSRLPFGILIHPFRDVESLSVVQCNTIVRCRNCRTYINPFVSFIDQRRWKCNLCFRVNDLPEEFLYDPSTRSYGDPARRPEVKNATIEFIAPSDYMLRPPQPAVYLFLLDVSHGAVETGYLQTFCKILVESLDDLPGDTRTRVGFITFDGSIHFYNLGEGLNQPHMLVVSDVEDVFLPSPDNLLVNLHESKALITDLLNDLPQRFAHNGDINSCLGAALQAAFKLMSPVGGRVTVVQTCLPNYGPGLLKNREDPNQRAAKDVSNIGPANDFYKKLALDCSGQQVAVDLFLLASQYIDIATISCISKYSSGSIHFYPGFHHLLGRPQVEKFSGDFKRYLTRRIGFEAVMRIRCTRGLTIHTFHGNFFVRSTDLLSLPNVNPDTGYAMQIAIEENLTEYNSVCFQAAVLYTSSNGERRIRVHTLSLPVVSILQDVLGGADQETVIGLVSKMAVDRSVTASLSDARDALINVCLDVLGVYKMSVSGQVAGALMTPYSLRLLPLFILALLKHVAFRTGVSTKLDERVFAMDRMKTLPLQYLMKYIYPTLYPVHALDEKNAIHQDDDAIIPQPVILQLSSEKVDRHGAYILDTHDFLYLYIGRAINDYFCVNVLNVPNFSAIPEDLNVLPELATPESERMRNFVSWLQDNRPFHSPLKIIKEDSRDRHIFLQYMLDDRTESLFSYYEFLQHIRQQISK